jgi:hypothetical protein
MVTVVKQAAAANRLSAARAALGAGHLAFPGRAARALSPQPIGGRARQVIRLLGARQLLQAAVTRARPTEAVLAVGAGIDALHAASMLALAAYRPEWRGPALTDAAVAGCLAVAGAAAARRC